MTQQSVSPDIIRDKFSKAMLLMYQHRLIAGVVSFEGPHINHLTPGTLDIDAVQKRMPHYQITAKEAIEGPPHRLVPILLRQTRFKALSEKITFTDSSAGVHTARFGEIEPRGLALTPEGRVLYDRLLQQAGGKIVNFCSLIAENIIAAVKNIAARSDFDIKQFHAGPLYWHNQFRRQQ